MASDFVKVTTGTDKVCLTNGLTIINGGGAIADMTLAAPQPGHRAIIRCGTAAGNIVVTTPSGVTLNGTNNTATFNAAEDSLVLVYNTSTAWAIESNTSVSLSTV